MSNHVCNLNGGAKVEISADGFTVVSVSGVRTKFDLSGNLINQDTADKKRYFFLMGKEEREAVKSWVTNVEGNNFEQMKFIQVVKDALNSVKYDYWISTIEPSMNKKGKLFFSPGKKVLRGISFVEWEKKGEEFLPERNSGLASLYELFLWYAWRIAKNLWSIEYVCDDSSSEGNYWNSICHAGHFEVSGNRRVGGFTDGIGNACKIVMREADFVMCGGYCNTVGFEYRVADIRKCEDPLNPTYIGTGVIVLRK